MSNEKTIGGTSQSMTTEQVGKHLFALYKRMESLGERMTKVCDRTERNLAILNLLKKSAFTVRYVAAWLELPTEMLAWAARTLFEINLILRFVLSSEDNLKHWMSQFATDEIQINDGLISYAHEVSSDVIALRERNAELRAILARHGRSPENHLQTSHLASLAGIDFEYKAFFKLYSKLVHPTSYSVNCTEDRLECKDLRNILLTQSQKYAIDTELRVSSAVGFAFPAEQTVFAILQG